MRQTSMIKHSLILCLAGLVLLTANAAPVPAKNTASIELVGTTEKAATAKPEALKPWADGKVWHWPTWCREKT